jgi:hypothetical protein
LLSKIRELQNELETDLEQKRVEFRHPPENHRARFEQDILVLHRRLRVSSLSHLLDAPALFILTAPVIYGAIVPMLQLDLTVRVYQAICFSVYKIPKDGRAELEQLRAGTRKGDRTQAPESTQTRPPSSFTA